MGQRGNPHGHPFALLCLGRAGGGEADADHFMDRSKEAKLGKTLEVSAGSEAEGRDKKLNMRYYLLYLAW